MKKNEGKGKDEETVKSAVKVKKIKVDRETVGGGWSEESGVHTKNNCHICTKGKKD